jgi:hypothetical protein
MSAVLSADVEPIPCSDRGDVDARERITAHMRYLGSAGGPPILPVMGGLGCSSNELVDLGARSKELPLVGYAFERVCAI